MFVNWGWYLPSSNLICQYNNIHLNICFPIKDGSPRFACALQGTGPISPWRCSDVRVKTLYGCCSHQMVGFFGRSFHQVSDRFWLLTHPPHPLNDTCTRNNFIKRCGWIHEKTVGPSLGIWRSIGGTDIQSQLHILMYTIELGSRVIDPQPRDACPRRDGALRIIWNSNPTWGHVEILFKKKQQWNFIGKRTDWTNQSCSVKRHLLNATFTMIL
jgi:hypothetical protein